MIHKPLLKATFSAILPYFIMLFLHFKFFHSTIEWSIVWFFSGLLYTHFFEYFFHRVPMHKGIKFLQGIKISHLEHHRIFYGNHFQSRNLSDLEKITMSWYEFPILFSIHYVIALLALPKQIIPIFFAGVVLHFLMYETSHWFTHVKDNFFDEFILSTPLIGDKIWQFRLWQITHHQIHHETPVINFNFNIPPLGDYIFKTYSDKPYTRKPRT